MTSTAVDVEQGSLSQRAVNSQVSSNHEKASFVDEQSNSEEISGNAWGPHDAWVPPSLLLTEAHLVQLFCRAYPFPVEPDEVEETHQLTLRQVRLYRCLPLRLIFCSHRALFVGACLGAVGMPTPLGPLNIGPDQIHQLVHPTSISG